MTFSELAKSLVFGVIRPENLLVRVVSESPTRLLANTSPDVTYVSFSFLLCHKAASGVVTTHNLSHLGHEIRSSIRGVSFSVASFNCVLLTMQTLRSGLSAQTYSLAHILCTFARLTSHIQCLALVNALASQIGTFR